MSTTTQINGTGNVTTTSLTDLNGNVITANGAAIYEHISLQGLSDCDSTLFPLKGGNLAILNILTLAGWGSTYHAATGQYTTVFGLPDQHPVVDPTSGAITYPNVASAFEMRWLYEEEFGTGVFGYNSNVSANPNPGASYPSGTDADAGTTRNVQWVPLGNTPDETASLIAAALGGTWVNTGGNYVITWPINDYQFTVANERGLSMDGYHGGGGNNQGAGYVFKSQSLNGMSLQMNISVFGNFVNVKALNDLGNTAVNRDPTWYQLGGWNAWTFIADQYSFYAQVEAGATEPDGDLNSGNEFYATTMPNTAHMLSPHQPATTLPQVSFRLQSSFSSLFFTGNDANYSGFDQKPGSNWYIGGSVTGVTNTRINSGLSLGLPIRQGDYALTDPNSDYDVILPVQVFMSSDGPTASGPMYYAGDMWNCVLVQRDVGPFLSSYVPDGTDGTSSSDAVAAKDWRVLFKQDDPVEATILIAVNDQNTSSSSGSPITPVQYLVTVSLVSSSNVSGASTMGTVIFEVTGGTVSPGNGYSWVITGLPGDWTSDSGLVIDPSEHTKIEITGPANTHPGQQFSLYLVATDSLGATGALQYQLALGGTTPVVVASTALTNGHVGVAYTFTLQGSGGSGTYGPWSLDSGSLPPGLTFIAATGVISGTPTTSGTYDFVISCKDSTTGAWSDTATAQIQVF